MKNHIKNTQHKKLRIPFLIYIALLHILLVTFIFRPDLANRVSKKLTLNPKNESVTHYMASMNTMHARVDKNTPENALIFIGDSLVQGLSVISIRPGSVNFGIGHDTVNGVLQRSKNYQSIKKSSAVIISIGINDLTKKTVRETIDEYKIMLEQLNKIPRLYIHEVLPIDSKKIGFDLQKKITLFNEELFKLTADFDSITLLESSRSFIDLKGDLKSHLHLGDGLHLNKSGYEVWIRQLKQQLDVK